MGAPARPGFLDQQRVLLLSYEGQKPLAPDVHEALANWVKVGGVLVFVDNDEDPYNHVREWWNEQGKTQRIPRLHLFAQLGVKDSDFDTAVSRLVNVGKGAVLWAKKSPVAWGSTWSGSLQLVAAAKAAAERAGLEWKVASHMALRRGPYLIGAGLDESPVEIPAHVLRGHFVDLFDPELVVQHEVSLTEGKRVFLLDLDAVKSATPRVLAAAGKILLSGNEGNAWSWAVEGVGNTQAIVLLASDRVPRSVKLAGQAIDTWSYSGAEHLLHIRFPHQAASRTLEVQF